MSETDPWIHWMKLGQFERAWQVSDAILGRATLGGEEVRGKRVLLRCEHGLGDTIQFIRYVRLLRPIASRILIHVQPRLVPLVARLRELDVVFTWEQPWPHGLYDTEIEIMDLPHLFRSNLETLPHEVPYLTVDPGLVSACCDHFRSDGPVNVGLQCECGNWDSRRSLPRETPGRLGAISGVALYRLEQGESCPDVVHTAAMMMNLDLIVTPDTMVAHLAGALGCPVWVLLPFEANWRWMTGRSDSPWYPTMRLYRQHAAGSWSRVLEQVSQDLAAFGSKLNHGDSCR